MGRLFGTDGVRGIANRDIDCSLAMNIGRAAASVLSNSSRRRPIFIVGKDTRISSDMLDMAISAGLCSVGADVISIGVVPTPAVAYLVGKYKADAGIMISASHNTFDFNGIKIFSGDGFKLPDALEEQIEERIFKNEWSDLIVSGENIGKVTYKPNAVRDYVNHLKSTVAYSLEGLKIVADLSNGSATKTAKLLFDELFANVSYIDDEPNGININENCGSTHLERLQKAVKEGNFDAGVAFDGDADRCLCVDSEGNIVDGDMIMAICALDMKNRGKLSKNAAVGTVMTNLGFSKFCEKNGIRFAMTKVGDRFVLEEMELEGYNFGGEQSGHIIFRDFATTGDGQLTAIQLLSLMRREGKSLKELSAVMTKYPQSTKNIQVTKEAKLAYYTDNVIRDEIEKIKEMFGNDGRIVVRPSGTEPLIRIMIEGENIEKTEEIAEKIANIISSRLG